MSVAIGAETRQPGRAAPVRRRQWIDAALTLLLVCSVLAAGAMLAVRLLGLQAMVEHSDSMAPALRTGDLLIADDVAVRELARGDIITFHDKARGIEITHRVVGVQPAPDARVQVITRGDANSTTEEWVVPVDSSVGRLAWRVPLAGRALDVITGRAGRVLGILTLTLLAGLHLLRRIWR